MKKEYLKIDMELVRKTVKDKGYYFIGADRLFDDHFVGPRLYIVTDDTDIIATHPEFAGMAILSLSRFEPIAQAVNEYLNNEDRERHRAENLVSLEMSEYRNSDDQQTGSKLLRYEFDEALKTLTDVQRKRVFLYYYKGLSEREIAAIERVSYKQVRKSLIQAQKKLKKYFSV